RYGTWRMQSNGCHVRWQRVRDPFHDRDCLPIHVCVQVRTGTASPSTPVVPATGTASLPTIRAVPPSSSSSPQEVESQHPVAEEGPQLPGRQPCWISGFAFTRPEDLSRAQAVWEITAQTNLRKSMWEVRDKAMKTTGNRDPMAWLDYDPIWLQRDYWESLCER
ncbi:hypothetical protein Taro_051123, partial [Colocasia esculenta]|nr:hypothetical protein [Colocasia esculenta]